MTLGIWYYTISVIPGDVPKCHILHILDDCHMCHVSGQHFTCVLVFYLPVPYLYNHTNVPNLPLSNTTRSFFIGFSLWADFILSFAAQFFPMRGLLFNSFQKKKSTGLSIFADAAAAEEPGPGGRNGAGTAGWGSGRPDQLHWPNHHANREAHLPHEEAVVALRV